MADEPSPGPAADARAPRELAPAARPGYSSPVTRRRRNVLIGLGAFLALLVAGGFAAVPYANRRARAEIESRCAALIGGTCTLGTLELARDGAVATRVRVRNTETGATAEVSRLAIAYQWWPLIFGREQGVTVRLSGVAVTSDAPLDDVVAEVRRIREARVVARASAAGAAAHRRLRIDRVLVDRASARTRLHFIFTGQLDDATIDWNRGGVLLSTWAQATVESGPLTAGRTGRCTLRREPRAPQATLDCEHFSTRLDVETAGERGAIVRQLMRTVMDGMRRAPTSRRGADEGDEDDGPFAGLTGILVRAREGTVELTRGEEQIVRLEPASLSVEVAERRVRAATVRFGAEGGGPAIEAEFTPGDAWRADVRAESLPLAELARWLPGVPWHGVSEGRARARVRVEPGDAGTLVVDGEAALEHFGLHHRALSREPIDGLVATVRGAAQFDLARRRVSTEGVTATLNGVTVALAGWAEHAGRHTAMDAALRVPATSCDAIRRSLPAAVTGPVNDLTFAGTVGADLRLALDTENLAATQLDVRVDDQCAIQRDGLRQGVRRLGAPFVQRVQEPNGLRAFVTGPGSAAWVPLANVSPTVVRAVLGREDGGFYRHHGFNLNEIRGAIVTNVRSRRFAYGASTITMQLAKNIFLRREKTLVRKLQEVVLTWYLEHSLDKDSILETYLNVVEFGPGIYGIGPASRFFFGREPRDLEPLQAIYLATLLPNPVARFANYQRGAVGNGTLSTLRAIARGMGARGHLSPAEVETAMASTVAFRPATTRPLGALTQNVDPDTTDDQAEAMSPMRTEDDAVADQNDAPETRESGDGDEPGRSGDDGGGGGLPARGSVIPVSLRTGGTI